MADRMPLVTAEAQLEGVTTHYGELISPSLTVRIEYRFGRHEEALRYLRTAYNEVVKQINQTIPEGGGDATERTD